MKTKLALVLLFLLAIVICTPVLFLLSGALMGTQELSNHLAPVLSNESGYVHWSLLPSSPTLKSYVELLLDSPEFFVMFWNSVKLTFWILIGQFVVGVPAAWGFARLQIPCKKVLFSLYVVLMLMPFQVTMLSNYLTLDQLNLIDTHYSITLPAIFSTFPVFIMHRFFCSIPESIMEAARLDGANKFQIFVRLGIPLGASGIAATMVLGFLEYWNLIEQPLIFLKNKTLWPLSLYLPNISMDKAGLAFSASVIALIPPLLVFLAGQDYLEAGIASTGLKE